MAEAQGDTVAGYLDEMKNNFINENPHYKNLPTTEINEKFEEWLYANFEQQVNDFAALLDDNQNVDLRNSAGYQLITLYTRMRENTTAAIYKALKKDVESLQFEIDNTLNSLNPTSSGTRANDLKSILRQFGITQKQYDTTPDIKSKVDSILNNKQTMRDVGLRGDLQGTREDLSYRADVLRRGQKEADRTRAYAEAAKRLGMAAEELPQKFKDEIDNNIDLGFDIDKLAALMGKAAQDNTKVYTNELARKGGWQESVVVQKDDSWKDRITSIAKLQEKIFNTENAINSKLGD